MDNRQRVQLKIDFLRDCGCPLDDRSMILDFGCGKGEKVAEFRKRGFLCYGCDIVAPDDADAAELRAAGFVRQIEKPYRLPFEDSTFDVVYSDQVLEHVRDHDQAFAEIARVLKPSGISVHIFPSRSAIIEPHVRIPLATWYRPYWWLRLWTGMGTRHVYNRQLSAKKAALWNFKYLRRGTNYLTRADLVRVSRCYFRSCSFQMRALLQHHPCAVGWMRLVIKIPLTAWVADTFHTHALVQHK